MRIPVSLPADAQQALRDVWAALDTLLKGNVDLHGRRLMNAGPAVDDRDYVTKGEISSGGAGDITNPTFQTLTVRGRARIGGALLNPALDDGGIVFAKVDGELATDVDELSYRYTNGSLRLGPTVNIRWHHFAEIRSGSTGVLELSGEDHNVSNAFARLAFGLDDASHPAIVVNGDGLDVRVGGGAGALSDLTVDNLFANNIAASGSSPTFADVTADHFIATAPETYVPTTPGPRRTFNTATVTLPELAEVVATLINDLATLGLVNV